MIFTLVRISVTFLCKSHFTKIALIRLLTSVSSYVYQKLLRVTIRLTAVSTGVRVFLLSSLLLYIGFLFVFF